MPHIIHLDAAEHLITSVTVYECSAEIVRKLSFELQAGQSEVQITGLPNCIDESSLRVEGTGEASLFDVVFQRQDAPVRNGPLHSELQGLVSNLRKLKRDRQVIDSQLSLLDGHARAMAAKDSNPSQFREFLREHAVHESSLREEAEAVRVQIANVRRSICETRRLAEAANSLDVKVTVVVLAQHAGSADLALRYIVTQASWSPLYDLRATLPVNGNGENIIELMYRASIVQTTGEDWKDINLSLSTNRSISSPTLPKLETQRVYQGIPEPHQDYSRVFQSASGGELSSSRQHEGVRKQKIGKNTAPQGGVRLAIPGYNPYTELDHVDAESDGWTMDEDDEDGKLIRHATRSLANLSTRSHHIRAAVVGMELPAARAHHGAVSTTFQVEGFSSIPSDGAIHKVAIAVLDLDADISWAAIPRVSLSPFVQCSVANSSTYVLLAGVSNIFLDGAFVGKSAIPFVSPKERFSLSLGTDPAIRISYPLVNKKKRSVKTGNFFLSQVEVNSTLYSQKIAIKNARETFVRVLVRDQVPVSENEKIRVAVTEPKLLAPSVVGQELSVSERAVCRWSSKDSDVSRALDHEKLGRDEGAQPADGEIEWIVSLAAGESTELVLSWEITAPEGEKWAVL